MFLGPSRPTESEALGVEWSNLCVPGHPVDSDATEVGDQLSRELINVD